MFDNSRQNINDLKWNFMQHVKAKAQMSDENILFIKEEKVKQLVMVTEFF